MRLSELETLPDQYLNSYYENNDGFNHPIHISTYVISNYCFSYTHSFKHSEEILGIFDIIRTRNQTFDKIVSAFMLLICEVRNITHNVRIYHFLF